MMKMNATDYLFYLTISVFLSFSRLSLNFLLLETAFNVELENL